MYYDHNCVNLTMNLNYEVGAAWCLAGILAYYASIMHDTFHACYVQNYAGMIGTYLNTKYFSNISSILSNRAINKYGGFWLFDVYKQYNI